MPNKTTRKNKSNADQSIRFERGSGNVFKDIGLPDPELALIKAKLVQHIRGRIVELKLTQVKAAKLLGIDQPKVSALTRGQAEEYSIDRLVRFLNALGQNVEINIQPMATSPLKRD